MYNQIFVLLCVISLVPHAASFLPRFHSSHKFMAIQSFFFFLNIRIFKNLPQTGVSHNVNISNLGNVLQRNLRKNRAAKEYILEHLEPQIFKILHQLCYTNYVTPTISGTFKSSMHVMTCPQNLDMSLQNQSKTVEAIERSQNTALQLLNLNGPQELAGYLYKKFETHKLKSVRIK